MIRGSQGYLKSSGKGKESWGKSLFEFNRGLIPDSTRDLQARSPARPGEKHNAKMWRSGAFGVFGCRFVLN